MLVTRCTRGTALALSTVRKTQRWNKEIGNDAGTVVRETGILDSDGNALRTVLLDPAAQPRSLCARGYSSRASLLIPPLIPRAPGGHRAPQPRPVAPPTVCGAHLHRSPARRRPDLLGTISGGDQPSRAGGPLTRVQSSTPGTSGAVEVEVVRVRPLLGENHTHSCSP